MILSTRFIALTGATVTGLTSYAAAAIVDMDTSSPHPPSDISATSNGKRSEVLVLKGSTATKEGATKFLKPKRNRKTKEYTRKLQAPQLFEIVVGNFGDSNQLLVKTMVLVDMLKLMLRIYQVEIRIRKVLLLPMLTKMGLMI